MTARRRVAWGVADQAVSSAGNVALGILAARLLDLHAFGAFGIAYTTYILGLGAVRALASDPLVVRWSAADAAARRAAGRRSSAAGVVLSVPLGLCLALAGLATDGALRSSLLALAVGLPALALQDALRYALLTDLQPVRALAIDVVWAVGQLALCGAVIALGAHPGPGALLLLWGAANAASAALGIAWAGTPRLGSAWDWIRCERDLGARFVVEVVASNGALQFTTYVVAAFTDLAGVAGFRGAQLLLGPLALLFVGGGYALVPEGARARLADPSSAARIARPLSIALVAVAAAYVALLLAVPASLLHGVLGGSTAAARSLLLPLGLAYVLSAVHVSCGVVLRVLQDARRSLRARLIMLALTLVAGLAGAATGGARGAAYGVLAANAAGAVIMLAALRSALRAAGSGAVAPGAAPAVAR